MAKEGESAAMHDPGVVDSMYAAVQSENNLLSSIYLIYRYVQIEIFPNATHATSTASSQSMALLHCSAHCHGTL